MALSLSKENLKIRLQKLIQEEAILLLTITTFVNLITWYASNTHIKLLIKPIFKSVFHQLTSEKNAQFILKSFGDTDGINTLVLAVCVMGQSFITSYLCIYIITCICYLVVFKSVTRIITFKKFKLETSHGLMNDINFIATWVVLYSLLNMLMKACVVSDFLYQILSIFSQSVVFYFMISNNFFGYKIKKRSRSIKT
jgi:hypothetical protein